MHYDRIFTKCYECIVIHQSFKHRFTTLQNSWVHFGGRQDIASSGLVNKSKTYIVASTEDEHKLIFGESFKAPDSDLGAKLDQ